MGNSRVDLTKLRDEIEDRKKSKGGSAYISEGQNTHEPKDSFLNELLVSLRTGKQSESTKLIKMVENKAAEKNGETPVKSSNTVSSELSKHSNQTTEQKFQQTEDRDELLYKELERRKKEFGTGGAATNNFTPTNEGLNLNSKPQQGGGLITENQLNEAVDKIIKDKFAHIVEQAMKDSIVEIYAETRMKEVLDENKEHIKSIVIETIRGLQKKKKPQQ